MYKMLLGLLALIGISFQPELQDTSKPEPFFGVICRTEKQAATLARYTFSRLIEGVEAIKKVKSGEFRDAKRIPIGFGVEIIKAPIPHLEEKLKKSQETLMTIGSINMRALEVYDQVKKEYDIVKEKVAVTLKICRALHAFRSHLAAAFAIKHLLFPTGNVGIGLAYAVSSDCQ